MRTGARHYAAIYENGVFRPLEPVDCPEHQKVVVWTEEPVTEESLFDSEFQLYCRTLGKNARPLQEVRHALAKIPGLLSDFIRTERDAD